MKVFPPLFLMLWPIWALAQEAPKVEVTIDPQGPVTPGMPVTISLVLLVPTFMPQPPVWPDLQIADAITRLPPDTSRPVSRLIGRDRWAGVGRVYQITPQRAADFALPPATIEVTYANPDGGAPITTSVPVPEIAFTATVPAGAEALNPFLAANGLTLTRAVDGQVEKPGDALTVTLTLTAPGTQSMLLPPLMDDTAPAGLRAYPRQPVLTDGTDGAQRIEVTTYVAERPGEYHFPAITLGWWNVAAGRVEEASADAIDLSVPAPPGWRDPAAAPARPWLLPLAVATGGVAALLLLGVLHDRIAAIILQRRRAEPATYRRLRRLASRAPVAALRPALAEWQAAAGLGRPLPEVEGALTTLERAAYGSDGGDDDRSGLLRALSQARTTRPKRNPGRPKDGPLPALNPW